MSDEEHSVVSYNPSTQGDRHLSQQFQQNTYIENLHVYPTPPQENSSQAERSWSNGLFGCFNDLGVCFIGLLSCLTCLPIIECMVSSEADECCCTGICCPIALRTAIRKSNHIEGSIMGDCCVLTCCHYCAFCQMQQELNRR